MLSSAIYWVYIETEPRCPFGSTFVALGKRPLVTKRPRVVHRRPHAIQSPSRSYSLCLVCLRQSLYGFFDSSNILRVYDPIIEIVCFMLLLVSSSCMLFRFGLLRTNTCVLVLPHATVSVVRVIRTSINHATRDFLPAVLRADEVPYGCVLNFTAY